MGEEYIPKETLKEAIGVKSAPMGITAAYEGANPNYDETHTYKEFIINCQRCVVANELRRRGYNVEALPAVDDSKLPKKDRLGLVRYTANGTLRQGNWTQAFRHAKAKSMRGTNVNAVIDNISNEMNKYGNNARGVISVAWKNGGGHVFNVENQNGKILFLDAQTGQKVSATDYLSGASLRNVTLTRTDNLRISDKAKKFVHTKRNVDKIK